LVSRLRQQVRGILAVVSEGYVCFWVLRVYQWQSEDIKS
jgi:hypothetical protein